MSDSIELVKKDQNAVKPGDAQAVEEDFENADLPTFQPTEDQLEQYVIAEKEPVIAENNIPSDPEKTKPHAITHYVLLPLYAWGAAEWDLQVIQPLLQEEHPTVGFSLTEARLADRVTVMGGRERSRLRHWRCFG